MHTHNFNRSEEKMSGNMIAVTSSNISSNADLCAYCFDCLVAHFNGESRPPALPDAYRGQPIECPMFVTLHLVTRSGLELRGCIGTLSPKPLYQMSQYVHSSAFEDRRFSPLRQEELRQLDVAFSVLTSFEPARDYEDWQIGVHGIQIRFTVESNTFGGTFLPEVAPEQGWSHKETIEALVKKAGYKGTITIQLIRSIEVVRYQSSKYHMNHQEYLEFKESRRIPVR